MFSNIISTFFSRIFSMFILLIVVVINSNSFGAEGIGTIGLIVLNVTILQLITSFIGGTTLVYLIPRRNISNLLVLSFLWAIIGNLLGLYILKELYMVPKSYTLLLLLISISCTFYNINITILQSFEKIKTFNLFQIIQSLFLITFIGASLLYFTFNDLPIKIDIYLLALLFSYVLGFFLSIIPIFKHLKSHDFRKKIKLTEESEENKNQTFSFKNMFIQLKEMLFLGFWVQIANLAQLLNYRLSYYFIEFYVGRKPLGIFDLGTKLSEAIWVFPKSLCLVQYARLSNTNDENYARKLTLTFAKIATLFTLIVVILLLLLPPTFFSFIFGAEFSEVKTIIYALAPGIVFLSTLTIISHHFAAKGLYWINGLSSLTGLIITLVGGFIFIPMAAQNSYMHAITVAGLITSCSYFVSLVFSMLFFFKKTQVSISDFIITQEEITLLQTEVRNLFSNLTKRK
ncbi:MAG: hypothetical protein CVU02_03555 [Bacteroidetes bacterium HGW-Bacteroidetes-19]|nr:MAG: hypothetical protein CVU02_03555 [Bacteroidetes bacterium HGW-Bacteroidetes-19]